ncbi:glycosyltransferase family 4 protein [Candidatus Daviesbacteria bacterium]|nr:glycosyltransferase family 4 protein [Candidatus Daviesbacteria bacterium]
MVNKIYILALAAHGKGISGGDRIFIEFARRWSKEMSVAIYVSEEGFQMCRRQNLDSSVKFVVKSVASYLARIVEGIKIGLTLKLENSDKTIIYSASEFWMDSLPCFILKLRYAKIKWVAAWYQTAPSPLKGFSGSFVYWLVQFPINPLIDRFANFVLVNNDEEKKQFRKAVVVLGAVDLPRIKKFIRAHPGANKIYDAVFQGRFHPQKGVLEMIDIWKIVVDVKPDAKLIMIGDGPLMKSVKLKVKKEKLENNIILTGYLFDGEEKYKIFAQSRVVVHPAIFDSGGMASAEAMAFGLPCVGFNLKAYRYYYPKGMEKAKEGDLRAFAEKILDLLDNKKMYDRISGEALALIKNNWSWEFRSRQILRAVLE